MKRLIAAVAVFALAALSAPSLPAGALAQAGIRVEADQTVEREYPPIPLANPAPATPATQPVNPNDCKTSPACDTIPLEIVPPATLAEADEFFVTVELIWQTMNTPGVGQGTPAEVKETAVNDLDLYVWEDPQGAEDVASSASSTTPEKLRMFRPVKGRYQIVVANYLGPNTGYKLKVTYKPERIETPFESLEPGYIPPPPEPEVPVTPPLDLSAEPEVAATPLPVLPAPAVDPAPPAPLAPVPVEPDADFAAGIDSSLDEELAALPDSDVLKQRQTVAAGPPRPASGSALAFWLLVLPIALVAGAGLGLAKRGSGVLRLR
jgi:hypothetical protein